MRVTEQAPSRSPEAQRLADQTPSKPSRSGRGLPTAPRDRKPGLAALAVLLIVGGALLTVTLVLRSGDRVAAIEISQRVGAGQPIPISAMKEVQIAQDGPAFVYWSAAEEMTRYYAAVDLMPGTLLNQNMISEDSAELVPGKAVVGLSLKPNQMPPNLQAGQRVQVVYVPGDNGDGSSRLLARSALVNSVRGGDSATGSANVTVSVVVNDSISPQVVGYAASGRIALAYLPGAKPSAQSDPATAPTPRTTPSSRATGTGSTTGQGNQQGTQSNTQNGQNGQNTQNGQQSQTPRNSPPANGQG
ncbi:hypothetical protein [Planotetraspora kaengkrachanensis]|uniref:SAF domain-containing protein n=1 Tax=Planotetraspora kaengkrachanensis TaxID=575193 RepID=A0A8J3PWC0_9ACTN|nr:hypothetical protein [Planotetraspora kaengkrachanensis]GIG82299.1 hypothetical protein Pka01_54260 [Planotetraspora kaengkrachanensis]